jgi:tetratricopeptide (TPR) repeat protein
VTTNGHFEGLKPLLPIDWGLIPIPFVVAKVGLSPAPWTREGAAMSVCRAFGFLAMWAIAAVFGALATSADDHSESRVFVMVRHPGVPARANLNANPPSDTLLPPDRLLFKVHDMQGDRLRTDLGWVLMEDIILVEDAEKIMSERIENHASAFAYRARATARAHYGKYEDALADFTRAIELEPKSAMVYCERSGVLFKLARIDDAIDDLSSALQLDPDNDRYLSVRAAIEIEKRQWKAAIADLSRLIELNPANGGYYSERAHALAENGDPQGALADCEKAITLCPSRPEGLANRGLVYLNLKQYEQAIADCSDAIKLDPKIPEAYFIRGKAKMRSGDLAGAEVDLERAVELRPGEAAFTLALKALQSQVRKN